jgi:ferric-dicitrate binding protein FerR (iron transport regulator)
MASKNKHSKPQTDLSKKTNEMIAQTSIDWGRSSEQIWTELEQKMDTPQAVKVIILKSWLKTAIAAALVLLAGIAVFMQQYTKNIRIPAGQHSQVYLPDQSRVKLNAQSTLSYKPLLWRFSRKVAFEGEAYFEVNPGRKFGVVSGKGSTVVLGTKFNIYARNNEYQVTCVSGSVKVSGTLGLSEVILNPGQKAALGPSGTLDVQSDVNTAHTLSWLESRFSFTSVPLSGVFEEISRQYGIVIRIPEGLGNTYTGTFNKDTAVENTLHLICKPFDLTFTRTSNDEYVVTKNQ